MTCTYQLAFYQQGLPEGLLAVARYTCYGEDGKIVTVETIEYGNNPEEAESFQEQVIASLECGIDVAVMTTKEIKSFPILHKLLKQ